MELMQFFDYQLSAMDFLNTVIIGFLATTFMFGLRWICSEFGLIPRRKAQGIGAFLIPEPVNEPGVEWLFHTIGGILFAFGYGFIFGFIEPQTIAKFATMGLVLGLVHGYFISFFVLMGFSGLRSESIVGRFSVSGPLMNIVAHVAFGGIVGLGMGMAELTGSIWRFAFILGAFEAILAVLLFTVGPKIRRERADEHSGTFANVRSK